MAVFNFSKISNGGTAKDYSYLVDALAIKENHLASDGKLSPGDYKLLKAQAQSAMNNPGLSRSQRDQLAVKISAYDKDANVTTIKDSSDIGKINREYKDDQSTISQMFANSPEKFLTAKSAALQAKIDALSSSINTLDASGDDTSNHTNELHSALTEYQDTLQALDDVKTKNPNTDFGAYVVTNSKGEVVDMKIEKQGAQNGYIPTNGLYGGMPLFGKENRKDPNGHIVFQLGNNKFTESNSITTGPDGTNSQKVLIKDGSSKGAGGVSINPQKVDIDTKTVTAQGSVRAGGWVQGDKGFLYQKQDDGSYKKYVNADVKKLGIAPNDIISVPRTMEQGIANNVTQTIDASATPAPQVSAPTSLAPNVPADSTLKVPALGLSPSIGPTQNQPTTTPDKTSIGRPQTGTPTPSAPSSIGGIANTVMSGAKSFLGGLFGK